MEDDKKCSCSQPFIYTHSTSSEFNHQVGGSHYKDYKIQPYEFFFRNKLPHHKAAIIRRICRYDHKTGKGREDLEKIKHEVDMIIELEGWNSTEDKEWRR